MWERMMTRDSTDYLSTIAYWLGNAAWIIAAIALFVYTVIFIADRRKKK